MDFGHFRSKPKLTVEEKSQLNIAFEFFWYTKTLLSQLEEHKGRVYYTLKDQIGDSFPSSPGEPLKSPHVVFRLYTAFLMFDQSFTSIPAHSIALTRNLILTMKTTFLKALQDYDRIKDCKECHHSQLSQLKNDLISLMAFPEFVVDIVNHQEEDSGASALINNFNLFVSINAKKLNEQLARYID